jgi:predicted  nucleic acid-binding Zn-ribbon protein
MFEQVQHRYNAVRVSSMKEARDLHHEQNMLKDTIKDVRKQLGQLTKTTA